MYTEKGRIVIEKGLMTYEDFIKAYTPHERKNCVLHFRIATHGKTNQQNTHPFRINSHLGMVHNGIINNIKCDLNPDMSDTWHFVEKILKPLQKQNSSLIKSQEIKDLIELYIGYSKLILLTGKDEVIFFNEQQGTWDSECWFSNSTYKTTVYNKVIPWSKPRRKHTHIPQNFEDEFNNYPRAKPQGNSKIFLAGDTAKLNTSAHVINPDYTNESMLPETKVKIQCFYSDNTASIINPINQKLARVSLWQLDEIEELPYQHTIPTALEIASDTQKFTIGSSIIFQRNFNHFRIGDVKTVTSVLPSFLIIEDKIKNKEYTIPKVVVKPASILEM